MNPSILSENKYWNHDTYVCVFTNGGNIYYEQSGDIDLLSLKVFYNPYSIANILALVDFTIQFRVTMDTNNKPAMFFHTVTDSVLKFYQCCKWMYYFDTSVPNVLNPSINAYSLLGTV